MLIFYLLKPESLNGVVAWEKTTGLLEPADVYQTLKVRDAYRAVSEVVTEVAQD